MLTPGVAVLACRFRAWWWLTIFAAAVTGWIIPYTIAFLSRADG